MMSWKLFKFIACAVAAVLPLTSAAQSTESGYPSKPIRLLVPYAPGGLTDSLGRTIAEHLTQELKQTVVVENRPGAGTQIGARAVSAAAPDGYTLLMATSTTLAAAPAMYKDHVDPVNGLTPISLVATNPFFLVTNAASGYKTVRDVVQDAAKQGTKGLSYGSAGRGSPHHLIMEMFREEARISLVHVPYSGSGTAINGLFDGSFNIMITDLAPARGFLQAGRLRALAVADTRRSNFLPEVPTFAEAGLPEVSLVAWQAVVGPPNLPAAIVARISDALHKMVDSPSFASKCVAMGCDAQRSKSPAEFREFVLSERQRWNKVLRTAGIEPR
jgi:tripartite-type tricarboxylate transporter receptor subunit TctC